ncbi:MAG: hypothetical protein ACOC3V_02985, partial [bacterium]
NIVIGGDNFWLYSGGDTGFFEFYEVPKPSNKKILDYDELAKLALLDNNDIEIFLGLKYQD